MTPSSVSARAWALVSFIGDALEGFPSITVGGAKAIGTGMIVLIGCGSVCSTLSTAYEGIWQVAVVWGLGVALAIYSTADISGAHLNPAITLAFQLVRPQVTAVASAAASTSSPIRGEAHGMTPKKSCLYMVAQLLGAIIAGFLNLAIFSDTIEAFERNHGIVRGEPRSILTAAAFGEYFPNPGLTTMGGGNSGALAGDERHFLVDDVTMSKALFVEAWGTFLLAFVIFGLTNRHNKVGIGAGAPFMIGMTVAVNLALYAPITQAGWNPARDFGPRIVAAVSGWGKVAIPGPKNCFWVYIMGPYIGGPLGAAFAEFLLWRRHPASKDLANRE